MIRKYIYIAVVAVSVLPYTVEAKYPDIENVQYVRNYDGDTVNVNIEGYPDIVGKNISIRVLGVDTPEIRGKCEEEKEKAVIVRDFVKSELSSAEDIKITEVKRDKYFRIVGDVEYDGKSLRDILLLRGYAYPYDGGTKINPWCEENN